MQGKIQFCLKEKYLFKMYLHLRLKFIGRVMASYLSIDRQRDEDVRRAVSNDALHEPYQFTSDVTRVPDHRRSPNYIRQDEYQTDQ